jgi:hypothetical protein
MTTQTHPIHQLHSHQHLLSKPSLLKIQDGSNQAPSHSASPDLPHFFANNFKGLLTVTITWHKNK